MKTLVVYNPRAGRRPSGAIVERAVAWWHAHGWQVEVKVTQRSGEAARLAREAASAGLEAVIVAGGDGTLSEAADGLAGSRTALGVFPIGTANVWAKEVGMPRVLGRGGDEAEAAARALAESNVRSLDLGRVGKRHFLLWLGVGLDGYIVSRVEPRSRFAKWLGEPYYVAAAFWAARGWGGAPMTVEVDGEALSGHMLLVLVGNNRSYAGDLFRPSPNAKLDDGLLEILAFEGRGFAECLALAWALRRGRHHRDPHVISRTGREIIIASREPAFAQSDGDLIDCNTPLTISVAPRALRMLVPANAPADLFAQPNTAQP